MREDKREEEGEKGKERGKNAKSGCKVNNIFLLSGGFLKIRGAEVLNLPSILEVFE